MGPIWGLMLENMSFSASQAGRRPPAFRSQGAQVRKQLSGPVGRVLLWASCRGLGNNPAYLQGFARSFACLSALGWAVGGEAGGWAGGEWLTSQGRGFCKAFTTASQAPRRARKRTEGGASSNVFSMFDQSQIQEFKEVGGFSLGPVGGSV